MLTACLLLRPGKEGESPEGREGEGDGGQARGVIPGGETLSSKVRCSFKVELQLEADESTCLSVDAYSLPVHHALCGLNQVITELFVTAGVLPVLVGSASSSVSKSKA